MNVASTVDTASVVDPKTSVSIRVQSISRMSPDAPDRKKQASTTARMGDALIQRPARAPPHGQRLSCQFVLRCQMPKKSASHRSCGPNTKPGRSRFGNTNGGSGCGSPARSSNSWVHAVPSKCM